MSFTVKKTNEIEMNQALKISKYCISLVHIG